MPTLKAKIGGAWVPIAGPGSGADEVFVGANDPGAAYELWYDTDDPGASFANISQVQTGTYFPTLGTTVIGAGGTNIARYVYNGGAIVGDVGHMSLSGMIGFGTSGQTFPDSGLVVSLPPGFNFPTPIPYANTVLAYTPVGTAQLYDATGALYPGLCHVRTATGFSPALIIASGTYGTLSFYNHGSGIPITFAVNDIIVYNISTQVVRV